MPQAVNPATEEVVFEAPELSAAEVDALLARSAGAFERWREQPAEARAAALTRLAEALAAARETYAGLITQEMGKPLAEARLELDKCVAGCTYFAEHGPRFVADEEVPEASGLVRYEPLGVVLAVMPWNYPFWQVFRVLAPLLAAGNSVVLKHASNVPQCALAIERAAGDAGLPDGLVQSAFVPGGRVRELIEDPRVAAVTVTSSTEVGAEVAATAGRQIKQHVLELGGSDAFLVRADADLDEAVAGALHGRFRNAGQACVAAKRFLVADEVYDAFAERLAERVAALRVGDPLDERTEIGPLANAEAVATLDRQVAESVAQGARRLTPPRELPAHGWYADPVVLGDVRPGMPVFDEETFGPVAPLVRTHGDDELVALANASQYGLGASVWSRDVGAAQAIGERLACGFVGVNSAVASDPALPFGGIRQSGYGRELGPWGVRAFTNVKALRFGR